MHTDITEEKIQQRHVFFDLGTNNGDSVKYFISKEEKLKQEKQLKGYGAVDNIKWEIYAFEANPFFNKIGCTQPYLPSKIDLFEAFTKSTNNSLASKSFTDGRFEGSILIVLDLNFDFFNSIKILMNNF